MRYFSNLYGTILVSEKIDLILGVDMGIQQQSVGSSTYAYWLTPTFIGQYKITEKWKVATRIEYYQDKTGVIIPTNTTSGFQTMGLSLNVDYSPIQNIMWRIEGRWFNSQERIFGIDGGFTNSNFFIGTSIAIKFSDTLAK